ncbi:putative regulator, MerR family (plasmid) [Legionella pneumophila subsp. pneumophila]|uniref:Regulator, MerR family n=7 Tax=Legionellaceae TaxID=444 RepID=A0AAV2V1P9_LEGPN|nr:putative regulator, MerR family [Legionella pneumophila subsp. pneumophila]
MLMKYYQIKEISQMTSLSIRSLQYYDEVGLLKPTKRSDSGYRLYSETDLLILQQIITLKFLGFSLSTIKEILANPNFNLAASMSLQARELSEKANKINEAASLLTYIASQLEINQPINWQSSAKIIEILELNTMSDAVLKKYQSVNESELGKKSDYDSTYNPNRLYPIPRAGKRQEIGIDPAPILLLWVLTAGIIMKSLGSTKKVNRWLGLVKFFMIVTRPNSSNPSH